MGERAGAFFGGMGKDKDKDKDKDKNENENGMRIRAKDSTLKYQREGIEDE
ncbi:hypothetical protein J2T13_003837 [Paenibacillus sp. DS2015]